MISDAISQFLYILESQDPELISRERDASFELIASLQRVF